jgi:ATP-dependent phosphofructokinase / diphosphate-dependent phosphofructokinase
MDQEITGNLLIIQAGQPCAVSNAALTGVLGAALNSERFENIYGAIGGFEGLLKEEFIDLAEESQQVIRGIACLPGMALGTSRDSLSRAQDVERAVQILEAHDIRFVVVIGDSLAQVGALNLFTQLESSSYQAQVISLPVSAENELPVTDHCLGYGSWCKALATKVREVSCELSAWVRESQVFILEVPGRTSGWLAAGAELAKFRLTNNDAPHLIYLPEHCLNSTQLVADVQNILEHNAFCMIVASEGLRDQDGNFFVSTEEAEDGPRASLSDILTFFIKGGLEVNVRSARLGLTLGAQVSTLSQTDMREAQMCAQAAVKGLLDGKTGRMVTLIRAEGEAYRVETGFAPLSEVTTAKKVFPAQWLGEDAASVANAFNKYAYALIAGEVEACYDLGLPKLTRPRGYRIQSLLAR